jgi:hypothetical protein
LKNQTGISFFDGTPVHYTDTCSRTRIYLEQLLRLQPNSLDESDLIAVASKILSQNM